MSQLADVRIACLGSGIMGGLLVKRLVSAGAVPPGNVVCSDTDGGKLSALAGATGVETAAGNVEAATDADVAILAVPPPAVLPVLIEVAPTLAAGTLVVSVAAGVTLAAMRKVVPAAVDLARVMPNTPSEVGQGMNTFVCDSGISANCRTLLESLLDIWGRSAEIEEGLLNAYCALLAVGPTYLLPVAGQLVASAAAAGVSPVEARAATAQLFTGVGALLSQTDRSTEDLLNMISLQPMDADTARKVIGDAYAAAHAKQNDVQSKLSG